MRLTETGELLALISAYDNRNWNAETTAAWYDLLHPYTLAEAKHAVKKHFNESTAWLLPAHIVATIKAARKSRLARAGEITASRADMTDAGTELTAQRAVTAAVASGAITVDEYEHYRDGSMPWGEYRSTVRAIRSAP